MAIALSSMLSSMLLTTEADCVSPEGRDLSDVTFLPDGAFGNEVGFGCLATGAFLTCLDIVGSGSFGGLYLRVIFFTPAVRLSTLGEVAWCDCVTGTEEVIDVGLFASSSWASLTLRDFLAVIFEASWSTGFVGLDLFAEIVGIPGVD